MLIVGPYSLNILQESVENSVSIHHVTRVTQEREAPDQPLSRSIEPEETSRQPVTELQNKNREQYAVERIVHHVTTKIGLYYVLRRYGYSSKDHAIKPLENLPKCFMNAF